MKLTRFVMTAALLASLAFFNQGLDAKEKQKAKQAPVALDGNCAVCLVKGQKVVKGSAEHSVVYDGQTYLFPSEEVKNVFVANPAKYVPALNGDCSVCFAHHDGVRNPGKIDHVSFYQGRVFLFPNTQIKSVFDQSPQKYADVDLACDGKCIVCKIDGGKDVPGKPEFTAIYKGKRYQFPSETVMQKFQSNPAKYVGKKAGAQKTSSTTTPASQLVSIKGTTGCAACEYGVHPKKDPNTLGLAVKSGDGKIYVIEGAHDSHPSLYKKRFESLKVSVKGKQIAQQGKFVWLEPQFIEKLQ
ncbi:YHS domain-containing protein [Gimesia fumaroli]|uniref:YHS domain protein n=1 Tax=Gimesia fumaroli TaxID=2527976 RepID=A0A518IJD8_9PLAN|nr:YHS domain-containing protein [Gimesia fumaroli]QDV53160.1 YHS domain protein [Gimesia fumaroli]